MSENNNISCSCGSCQLFLNDPLPKYSVMCACEDCRQALRWAEINGGKKPKDILYSVYFRSDIQSYNGIQNMIATQLRSDARSTRIYCKKCFSCLAIDHVNYQNNIFMIQPDHCTQNFNVDIPPKAVINLIDYPEEVADLDSETIPIFHTTKYPQERKRFLSIEPIIEFLAPPKTPAKGITIREIILKIGKVEKLQLTKGESL
tara:strand:+ start:194 stop:802 length:609 start_codon:yes stop_codon:yes gene_type:complete